MTSVDQMVEIFRHLTFPEILHTCSANNQWRRFCQQDDLWQKYFQDNLESAAIKLLQAYEFQDALILSTLNPTFKELFDQTSLWRKAIPDLSELIDLPWDQFLAVSKLAPFFNLPEYWQESLKERSSDYREDMSLRWNLAMYINTQDPFEYDRSMIEKLTTQIPLFRWISQDPQFWRDVIDYLSPIEIVGDPRSFFFHEMTWSPPIDDFPDDKARLIQWLTKKAHQERDGLQAYQFIDERDPKEYHRIFICSSDASFIRQLFLTYPDIGYVFQEFYRKRVNQIAYDKLLNELRNDQYQGYRFETYPLTYESQ